MNALIDPATLDLAAYLERIGYRGETRPSLEVLAALQQHHACHITFENLSPFLGEPVSLEMPDLQAKLVDQARGGYCFEQNLLLAAVLTRLGFAVGGLAARVFWQRPEDARPPRTHMLLRVAVDGIDYLVDVGFGGMTPTAPLRLDLDGEQHTPHEPFRLRQDESRGYRLQARPADQWQTLYGFDLQPQQVSDYQVTSWYLSHHPGSRFVTDLVASRPAANCRHSLVNNRYTVHYTYGSQERRWLTDADQLIELLAEVFGVRRTYDVAARRRIQTRLDEARAD